MQPLPSQKSLPSMCLWSVVRQTGGIFWERSCSPVAFLLLASCCCFTFLISLLSLPLHVSPSEARCGSFLPPPHAHPGAKIQDMRGSVDRPPWGFENHKISGMPVARRPNIQCIQPSPAPSESIHPAPKSFDIIIAMVASKWFAKRLQSQVVARCKGMNYSNIRTACRRPSSCSPQKQLQGCNHRVLLGCNNSAIKK